MQYIAIISKEKWLRAGEILRNEEKEDTIPNRIKAYKEAKGAYREGTFKEIEGIHKYDMHPLEEEKKVKVKVKSKVKVKKKKK